MCAGAARHVSLAVPRRVCVTVDNLARLMRTLLTLLTGVRFPAARIDAAAAWCESKSPCKRNSAFTFRRGPDSCRTDEATAARRQHGQQRARRATRSGPAVEAGADRRTGLPKRRTRQSRCSPDGDPTGPRARAPRIVRGLHRGCNRTGAMYRGPIELGTVPCTVARTTVGPARPCSVARSATPLAMVHSSMWSRPPSPLPDVIVTHTGVLHGGLPLSSFRSLGRGSG